LCRRKGRRKLSGNGDDQKSKDDDKPQMTNHLISGGPLIEFQCREDTVPAERSANDL
jgi:hypothetical protein